MKAESKMTRMLLYGFFGDRTVEDSVWFPCKALKACSGLLSRYLDPFSHKANRSSISEVATKLCTSTLLVLLTWRSLAASPVLLDGHAYNGVEGLKPGQDFSHSWSTVKGSKTSGPLSSPRRPPPEFPDLLGLTSCFKGRKLRPRHDPEPWEADGDRPKEPHGNIWFDVTWKARTVALSPDQRGASWNNSNYGGFLTSAQMLRKTVYGRFFEVRIDQVDSTWSDGFGIGVGVHPSLSCSLEPDLGGFYEGLAWESMPHSWMLGYDGRVKIQHSSRCHVAKQKNGTMCLDMPLPLGSTSIADPDIVSMSVGQKDPSHSAALSQSGTGSASPTQNGHRSSNASLSDKGRLRLQALGSSNSMGSGRSAPCCHVSPEELKGSNTTYRDGITAEESGAHVAVRCCTMEIASGDII
eukprot:s113_g37.t1